MAKISSLSNIWSIVKEADLRPLAEAATRGVSIAIIGTPGSGRSTLAEILHHDPERPEIDLDTPVSVLDLTAVDQAMTADFIILMVRGGQADTQREQEIARAAHAANKPALVFINHSAAQLPQGETLPAATPLASGKAFEDSVVALRPLATAAPATTSLPRSRRRGVVRGSIHDPVFLTREFAPAVIELLPDDLMGLGRFFPFFRVPVAHFMINDSAFTNAAYSFSTGLAEIVPVLNIPFAVADMVILTKNQLFLIYKLGLALGYSTRWQDYAAEFGSVLGVGFLWRQIARSLVGLIPVWGIIPKTAISYAGTYTVGNVILQWYLTGRHLNPDQVKSLYMQSLDKGRGVANRLLHRSKRLPQGAAAAGDAPTSKRSRPRLKAPSLPRLSGRKTRACPQCGRANTTEAHFCQNCGFHFGATAEPSAD